MAKLDMLMDRRWRSRTQADLISVEAAESKQVVVRGVDAGLHCERARQPEVAEYGDRGFVETSVRIRKRPNILWQQSFLQQREATGQVAVLVRRSHAGQRGMCV